MLNFNCWLLFFRGDFDLVKFFLELLGLLWLMLASTEWTILHLESIFNTFSKNIDYNKAANLCLSLISFVLWLFEHVKEKDADGKMEIKLVNNKLCKSWVNMILFLKLIKSVQKSDFL